MKDFLKKKTVALNHSILFHAFRNSSTFIYNSMNSIPYTVFELNLYPKYFYYNLKS